jgi:hypothetical protein
MANIFVRFSQSVVSTNNGLSAGSNSREGLNDVVDEFFQVANIVSEGYPAFNSWSLVGNTLRLSYPGGASATYNVSQLNSSETSGTAVVSDYSFLIPNAIRYSVAGSVSYDYSLGPGSFLSLSPTGGSITSLVMTTLVPSWSASYNQTFGNVSYRLNGQLQVDASGNVAGKVSSISSTADKFLKSISVQGSFDLSGNSIRIGRLQEESVLAGSLTSYSEQYADGSFITVDMQGQSFALANNQPINEALLANSASFPGADTIDIDLPSQVFTDWKIHSGQGDDKITLKGGGGRLSADAGAGNDQITLRDHVHVVNGGEGTDTVKYTVAMTGITLSRESGSVVVRAAGGTDYLQNVERVEFLDKSINLSIQSLASSIPATDLTRLQQLYVAFFNRAPDADGLAYWIGRLKAGDSLDSIADAFYSAGVQYSSLTGFSSSMSNTSFVNVIYKNVLGRTDGGDADGVAYWSGKLASGEATRGSLVSTMLDSAASFKGHATFGWVADLLQNKATVAQRLAVEWGLNFTSAEESISRGMQIAAAVTPTSINGAIELAGVQSSGMSLY